MIRGRDIQGLPVITRDTGDKIGRVEDLVIDRTGSRVLGIVVDEKGLFHEARVAPWSAVQAAGYDSVIIDTEASVAKAATIPEIEEVLERGFILQGSRVQTTSGRMLGKIENFFFDPATGSVQGFELVGGLNDQQPSGSSFLPAASSFEAGREYSFVDQSVVGTIEDLATALKTRNP